MRFDTPDPRNTVGAMSEQTKRNIRRARAWSVWAGPLHIEWKVWTGQFRLVPAWSLTDTEFFNEGPIRWWRGYWLCLGLSVYKALPERRVSVASVVGVSAPDERRGKR
jgi:hypothetical protein